MCATPSCATSGVLWTCRRAEGIQPVNPIRQSAMFPHQRILLAALAFSASAGVLMAVAGWAAFAWLSSIEEASEGAVRGAGMVTFYVAPAIALVCILFSVPLTYASMKWRPRRFWAVALVGPLVAVCGCGVLFVVGFSLKATLLSAALLSAVFVVSSYLWWKLLPLPESL